LTESSQEKLVHYKEGEIVNVFGVIVQRRLERTSSGGDTTLVLEISQEELHAVFVYVKTSLVRLQSGLVPGTAWRITGLKKMVSKKENIYLVSTVMSRLTLVGLNRSNLNRSFSSLAVVPSLLEPISSLLDGRVVVANILFSIKAVARINIRLECGACSSLIENGACSYVGCNAPPSHMTSGSGCYEIEDGSGTVLLTASSLLQITNILDVSEVDEEGLRRRMLKLGQIKYSKWSATTSDQFLSKLVERCMQKFYVCKARVRRYVCDGEVKLFCIRTEKPCPVEVNKTLEAAIGMMQTAS